MEEVRTRTISVKKEMQKQLYQAYDPEKAKELLKEAGYDESNSRF